MDGFSLRDIEEIKDNYEDDFKAYNKLMEEVAKKPIVSKCCLRAGMWDVLDGYRTKFIHHRLACKKLLELKQKSLPRSVYYISNKSPIPQVRKDSGHPFQACLPI